MANAIFSGSPLGTKGSELSSTSFPAKLWNLLGCFRSVQLAIILISLLALGVLAGVMIPQDGLVETTEIKPNLLITIGSLRPWACSMFTPPIGLSRWKFCSFLICFLVVLSGYDRPF